MARYADNTRVLVHYTGKLEDGTIFDSTEGEEPLEVTMGTEMVLPKFEEAIQALEVGEKTTVSIDAEEGYGEYQDELLLAMPKDHFPGDIPMERGVELTLHSPEGEEYPAVIVDVEEDTVMIDANHPLAGETLTFEIELVQVDPA